MQPIASEAFANSIGLALHPEANAYRSSIVWPILTSNLTAVLNPAAGASYTADASNQIKLNVGADVIVVEF